MTFFPISLGSKMFLKNNVVLKMSWPMSQTILNVLHSLSRNYWSKFWWEKFIHLALRNNGKVVTIAPNIGIERKDFGSNQLLGFRTSLYIFQNMLRTNSCLANYLDKRKADKRCFKFLSTATPPAEQRSHREEDFSFHHDQSAFHLWWLRTDLESFKLSQSLFTSASFEAKRDRQKNVICLFFWKLLLKESNWISRPK